MKCLKCDCIWFSSAPYGKEMLMTRCRHFTEQETEQQHDNSMNLELLGVWIRQ